MDESSLRTFCLGLIKDVNKQATPGSSLLNGDELVDSILDDIPRFPWCTYGNVLQQLLITQGVLNAIPESFETRGSPSSHVGCVSPKEYFSQYFVLSQAAMDQWGAKFYRKLIGSEFSGDYPKLSDTKTINAKLEYQVKFLSSLLSDLRKVYVKMIDFPIEEL